MNFKQKILTNKKIAVHCKTKDQAVALMNWAHKNGKQWSSGDNFKEDRWERYEENTGYFISAGLYGPINEIRSKKSYDVLSFEEALEEQAEKKLTMKEKMLEKKKQAIIKQLKKKILESGLDIKEENNELIITVSDNVQCKIVLEEVMRNEV